MQKCAVAGIPLIAGVSAPSSLALDLAEATGVTVIGFLRPSTGTVYTHPEHLAVDAED